MRTMQVIAAIIVGAGIAARATGVMDGSARSIAPIAVCVVCSMS